MNRRIAFVLLLVAIPLLGLVAARSRGVRVSPARPVVLATIYPLAEFASRIGGDRVEVRTLVPAGTEAHDFEPGPQDVAAISRARLLIYNGAGFEPWVERLLPTLPTTVGVVRATAGLPLIRTSQGTSASGKPATAGVPGKPATAGVPDPHAWLDPLLAAQMLETILIAFAATDPAGEEAYRQAATVARGELAGLHARFSQGLARCEQRLVVSTHTAFAYLARRYGLEHIGLAGLAPEADPTPAALARLARTLRARGVRVVFVERPASPRAAETLAREIGARTMMLHPVEGLTPEEIAAGANYVTIMDENLRVLREGLGCRQ
ncbi:MAG: ABC transporter substrate-binding protein [Armatimonadetes bacterium]|nr:ABC transporter substrate-binding protein [Armatimonadota bacterium]